ncbi:MAG: DUF2303 family protein [Roseovarius sp.]|nr:DUF2303 family protein [Roseovarius sp.]
MSLDASAITKIEELCNSGSLETPIPSMIIPSGNKLQNLESLMHNPCRMRQRYTTERIPDFVRYVNENVCEGSTVTYVSPDGASAHAIIDHGTHQDPEWGDHTADLALVKTTAYQALEKLCAQPRKQQDLIDYLEDWGKPGFVECLVNGQPVAASVAIAAIRRVEINAKASTTHEQNDFRASRTAMEEIEAKAAEGSMPGHIRLYSPVYVGTEERVIYIRIGITPIDDKPAFRLRIMQVETMQEAIAREVEERLQAELHTCQVYIGTVNR